MILKAICDYYDPRYFEFYRKRYNQDDIFVSYQNGSKNGYDGRFGGMGRYWSIKSYRRPEDEEGLVGFNE